MGDCSSHSTKKHSLAGSTQQASKPNILFILNDNTGYGDIGVYGGGERRGAPTPSIDHLASEGLLLTQFLVEPSCTPSRAALMTGRYSIRSGLSLILLEGTSNSLPASEVTMAEMLHDAGYATALFGKWHLGSATSSLPQNKGFDEFYGIPPNASWNSYLRISQVQRTQHVSIPLNEGPQIYEAKRGGPLKVVKPYTEEVRRNIDWELVERGIDFMKRQKAASKPFFLYIPVSRTHFPNLPSKKFEGSSRIGQFGDSLIEGDAAVGALLDALKSLGLEDNTIVAFASDNGPEGPGARDFGRHAGHGIARAIPRLSGRRERRFHPYPGHHSLAGPYQSRSVERNVLDHGLLPDIRTPRRRQGAK